MKKTIVFLLCLCLSVGIVATGFSAVAENSDPDIIIDGKSFAPPAPLIIENGTTYVPLRAFCERLDPLAKISWDNKTKTATVECTGLEISMTLNQKYLVANERYLYIPNGCFSIDGNTMVPVRQLAKAFGATIDWDATTKTISITTGSSVIEHGELYYNPDEVFWLSRIIFAESGAECLDGQIGVGNVVLNRAASDNYPDTIYDVIFDTQFGTQFTPVSSGAIFKSPTKQCEIAAKLALDGAKTVDNSLFFVNTAMATSTWIMDSCDYVVTIGGHSFYA